jgi:hypothetical protein
MTWRFTATATRSEQLVRKKAVERKVDACSTVLHSVFNSFALGGSKVLQTIKLRHSCFLIPDQKK